MVAKFDCDKCKWAEICDVSNMPCLDEDNQPESDFSGAWHIAMLIFTALLICAGTAGFIFACDFWGAK